MTTADDELLLKLPAEPFTLPVMFTSTNATLVGNISRSQEELTGILGPMVTARPGGFRALNSNFGHYCQAGYESSWSVKNHHLGGGKGHARVTRLASTQLSN